jgi:acetyltransferase-like isoleucine patch superfamily enzyme
VGNNVNIGQHVILSGLNHDYQDILNEPSMQKVFSKQIVIQDNVWIGANSVILPGISIGAHSMIGAGSVVTKDIPAYCLAVGNPARIVKQYDVEKKQWVKVSK